MLHKFKHIAVYMGVVLSITKYYDWPSGLTNQSSSDGDRMCTNAISWTAQANRQDQLSNI